MLRPSKTPKSRAYVFPSRYILSGKGSDEHEWFLVVDGVIVDRGEHDTMKAKKILCYDEIKNNA